MTVELCYNQINWTEQKSSYGRGLVIARYRILQENNIRSFPMYIYNRVDNVNCTLKFTTCGVILLNLLKQNQNKQIKTFI